MRIATAVFLLLLLALPGWATIIEVPADYADLQAAINASSNGDTVLVAPGNYNGPFNFNGHAITLASHYILNDDESLIEQTVLNGANAGTVITIENLQSNPSRVIGFLVHNGLGTGNWPNVHGGGMHISGSYVEVSHCIFEDCSTEGSSNRGAGIYFIADYSGIIQKCTFRNLSSYFGSAIAIGNDSDGVLIEECVAYDNTCTADFIDKGVYMVTYSNEVTFRRCLAFNNAAASGFRIWSTTNAVIDHCTSAGNDHLGIAAMYTGNDLTVTNSIAVGGPGYDGISQEGYTNTLDVTYTDARNGTGEPWFGTGCIDADPLFADPAGGDYNLTADSPCLDAADPTGEEDPDGTPPDMGALPFMQGPPPPVVLTLNNQTPSIPPDGGTLFYDATLTSTLPQLVQAQGWTEVILPNGQEFGPLILVPVNVAPGEYTLFNLQQAIPAIAPGGEYEFIASVGYYPVYVGTQDSFTFTKSGTIATGSIGFDPDAWAATPWTDFSGQLTAAGDEADELLPAGYRLAPVYPNPFNPTATVAIELPESARATVTVVNIHGQRVATLHDGALPAGRHEFSLGDAGWASGVYFVRAVVPGRLGVTRRAVMLR